MGQQGKKNNQLRFLHGWTSKTKDNRQVIFLDFDTKNLDWILEQLRRIREFYGLSDFYVFSTRKGFHAVCIDKFSRVSIFEIQNLSLCDKKFMHIGMTRKSWTLRLSEKNMNYPKFLGILFSNHQSRAKSHAHLILIKAMMKLENVILKENPINLDKSKYLEFCSYIVRGK